jgi:transcriptional regulator with XRE-family HTH domain
MTIGQKIKEIRELKGMTLEGVANLTGISRQRVQAIEAGTGYPLIPTIQKIANALRCPLRDILNEPLELYLDDPKPMEDTDCPCANSSICPFFKKKE